MSRWTEEYRKAKCGEVNYEAIGSSAGVKRLATGVFDFACTDAPLSEPQLAAVNQAGGDILYIPLILGAVVPAYNVPGFEEPLTFSGAVLADIFLGKITHWNDKALQDLNSAVTLPDLPITVVHRSDGSGTTYIWTDYLTKVSAAWRRGAGVGMSVKWPAGSGRPGNAGVAEMVKSTPGAIGYVQLGYALRDRISVGLVRNRAGTAVRATSSSVTAAAKSSLAEIPADLHFSLTDPAGADAYPISGTVWAIVYARPRTSTGKALADFLRWATHDGQGFAEGLHYARLPDELVGRIDKKLDKIAGMP
jgi:phosphate transport system substrate-binding protein